MTLAHVRTLRCGSCGFVHYLAARERARVEVAKLDRCCACSARELRQDGAVRMAEIATAIVCPYPDPSPLAER